MIRKYGFWFGVKKFYTTEMWIVRILITLFLTIIYLLLALS
jgi:hypothetical protein